MSSITSSHPTRAEALAVVVYGSSSLQLDARDAHGRPLAGTSVELDSCGSSAEDLLLGMPPELAQRFLLVIGPHPYRQWMRSLLDATGTMRIEGLWPGFLYRVRLTLGDDSVVLHQECVELAPSEEGVRRWTIACTPLAGRLRDQHGEPVADCTIGIRGVSALVERTTTGADGRFELCLAPEGELCLELSPSARNEVPHQRFTVALPALHRREPVELRIDRGLYLRGRLLTLGGVAAAHGRVTALLTGEGRSWSTDCAANGSFRLGPLLAGEYELTGIDLDASLARDGLHPLAAGLRVHPGDEEIVLRCE